MTKTPLETLGRSVNDRLRNLATKSGTPFDVLLSYFLLERLAVRLASDEELSGRLVFKGGYVSLRVYHSPRSTTDLDALLTKGTLKSAQKLIVQLVETDVGDGVWFKFGKTLDLTTQGEYGGLRIIFRAGIGEPPKKIHKARTINLDLGTGDPVVPSARAETTPLLLGDGKLSWKVYPVETICSEKLHSLIVLGSVNSRAKDVFDLNLLLSRCDSSQLAKALRETFAYRGDSIPPDIEKHLSAIDFRVMKAGWKSAVAGIADPGTFEGTYQELLTKLKKLTRSGG